MKLIATALAIIATLLRVDPAWVPDFTANMSQSMMLFSPGEMVGLTWPCGDPDDDWCYAGLIWFVDENGNPQAMLDTGP